LADRRLLGAEELPLAEYRLAVADAAGGRSTIVIGTWRDDPLHAVDARTGELLWSSHDLRRVDQMTAYPGTRLVGVNFRDSAAKVVSSDTGKYRITMRGVTILGASDDRVATVTKKGRLAVHAIEDGRILWARDAAVESAVHATFSRAKVVFAAEGLHAFDSKGDPVWTFRRDLYFSHVVAIEDGFRALAHSSGTRTVVTVTDDGALREERAPDTAFYEAMLGPRHIVNSDARVIDVTSGADSFCFRDEMIEVVGRPAPRRDAPPETSLASRSVERVVHAKFGRGVVVRQVDDKLVIAFDDGVERTLAASYVRRE
jgi:hypothetical protein